MRKQIEPRPASSRRFWVADARRRDSVVERDLLRFRWHTRSTARKRISSSALAAAALLFLSAGYARASFEEPAIGARSAAMGGASLAGGGDSAALFLNPAGTSGLGAPEAYLMYDQLYAGLSGVGGLSRGFAAFGVPTKVGVLDFGLSDFQASGLLEERVVGVSLAGRLFGDVEAGVTGKYLYHRYLIAGDSLAASDPVFRNGTARGAFALDAGVIVPVANALTAGLAVRNINEPDVGLATADRVPREIQAGLAYAVEPWALRWTADYTYRDVFAASGLNRHEPALGVEKSFENGQVKFRAGATLDRLSAGIGVQFGGLGFDYTFLISRTLAAANAGTHMVGIRYRFGDVAQSASRSH